MQATRKIDHIQIQRGRAIVLVGPQGCGKSITARQIAEKAGTYEEFTGSESMNAVLLREPATVIVEGPEAMSKSELATLKGLITSERTTVRRPYSEDLRTVRTPNFIFCSYDTNWLPPKNDRRFFVVHL